jgi:hypothetical protein
MKRRREEATGLARLHSSAFGAQNDPRVTSLGLFCLPFWKEGEESRQLGGAAVLQSQDLRRPIYLVGQDTGEFTPLTKCRETEHSTRQAGRTLTTRTDVNGHAGIGQLNGPALSGFSCFSPCLGPPGRVQDQPRERFALSVEVSAWIRGT